MKQNAAAFCSVFFVGAIHAYFEALPDERCQYIAGHPFDT